MVTPAQAIRRRRAKSNYQLKWFGNRVKNSINTGMSTRIKLAAQFLRDRVVVNLSKPVRKYRGPRSGRTQVDPASRSKPGEFPRADTTHLMKTTFWQMQDNLTGIVGTPLGYGLLLETTMDRSFLRRTLNEVLPQIKRITTMRPKRDFPGNK